MIDIKNLKLWYDKRCVIDIPRLTFTNSGFYALVGPSGCGKTSLLNVIAGIVTGYEGKVLINNKELSTFGENEKLFLRQKIISICYQDSVLFDDLSVLDNLLVRLAYFDDLTMHRKNQLCEFYLKKLKISHLKHKKVKYLSGGEKQRVSIARALVSKSQIVLLDEPTSALDIYNARLVFSLLREYSKEALVIVVTHHRELALDYTSVMIDLSYGKVSNQYTIEEIQSTTIESTYKVSRARGISLCHLFKLARTIFEGRRRRNFLASITFTFSLTAICSLLVITTSVSAGIKGTFAINYSGNTTLIKYDKKAPYPYREAAELTEVEVLARRYDAKVGTHYLGDLTTYFPTSNRVYFKTERMKIELNTLNINHFNHITLIEEISLFDLYGYRRTKLRDDEVILMLSPYEIRMLYEHLNLRKGETLERLGNYIKENDSYLIFKVENEDWGFEDEQIFHIVAVIPNEHPGIIHSNPNLPKVIFEDKMQFRSSYKHSVLDEYPWTLKKIHYLYKKDHDEILINEIDNEQLLLARTSPDLFNINNDYNLTFTHHISIYKKPATYFPLEKIHNSKELDHYLLINNGLITVEESLMIGFADHFLLSTSKEQLEEVISYDEHRLLSDNSKLLMGPKMLSGHYSLSLTDGITFNKLTKVDQGRKPEYMHEIVVSKKLFNDLISLDFIDGENYQINCAYPRKTIIENDYIKKDYEIITLSIVGIVNEKRPIIYQASYWPLLLFKDLIKMDPFNAIPIGVISHAIEVDDIFINNSDFEVTKPYQKFSSSIDMTIKQITSIIYVVAISSILMATIVIFLVIHSLLDDFYRHFALLQLIGYSKKALIMIGVMTIGIIVFLSVVSSLVVTTSLEILIARVIFKQGTYYSNWQPYFITLLISSFTFMPSILLLLLKVKGLKLTSLTKNNL